jgi:hypothetical protein
MADLAWYSLVSFGAGAGKKFISDTVYQWIISACGLMLIVFGAWFLFGGVRLLFKL